MELTYAIFGASYVICQILIAQNALQLWRALPDERGVPILRWSFLGMSWTGGILGQVVLLLTAPLMAPMFIMGRQLVFGSVRATVCVYAWKKGYITYNEARSGWLQFEDSEELWDAAAGVSLDE